MDTTDLFKIGATEVTSTKNIETVHTEGKSGSIKIWHGESITVTFESENISGKLTFSKGVIDKKVDLYKRAYETLLLILSNDIIKF